MLVLNKQVAVKPITLDREKDQPRAKGLDITDLTITKIISSEVVFDSGQVGLQFSKGDTVYFRSDILKLPYVRQKMELDGKEFILVPEEIVVGLKTLNKEG